MLVGRAGHAGLPGRSVSARLSPRARLRLQPSVTARSTNDKDKGDSLGDSLLDYVMAGPKMRKWYGQGERRPRGEGDDDQGPEQQQQPEEEEGDQGEPSVLVLDADSQLGELMVLQLILARLPVKAVVRDVTKAKQSYGPYVQPLSFDTKSPAALQRALKNVWGVVVLGIPGALPQVAQKAGVRHVVCLSSAGMPSAGGLFGSLFDSELSGLKDTARETTVASSGVPCSVVRVGAIRDAPGGTQRLTLSGPGTQVSSSAPVAREDVAAVLLAALSRFPRAGSPQPRVLQLTSPGPGQPPSDWDEAFKGAEAAPAAA